MLLFWKRKSARNLTSKPIPYNRRRFRRVTGNNAERDGETSLPPTRMTHFCCRANSTADGASKWRVSTFVDKSMADMVRFQLKAFRNVANSTKTLAGPECAGVCAGFRARSKSTFDGLRNQLALTLISNRWEPLHSPHTKNAHRVSPLSPSRLLRNAVLIAGR